VIAFFFLEGEKNKRVEQRNTITTETHRRRKKERTNERTKLIKKLIKETLLSLLIFSS